VADDLRSHVALHKDFSNTFAAKCGDCEYSGGKRSLSQKRALFIVVEAALPIERLLDDLRQIAVAWPPAQRGFNAIRPCDERGGVSGAAASDSHRKINPRDSLDDVDDFENREASSISAIAGKILASFSKVSQC
jgi:hypothetical protein